MGQIVRLGNMFNLKFYVSKKKRYKCMKKNERFSRKSTPFLKSACLALCLVGYGGSAVYAGSSYATQTMLTVQMNGRSIKDVFS